MMVPSANVETLLAIDVGAVNTRAFLFGIADGTYRYLAIGQVPSTVGASFNNDIGIGISNAIENLQEITGRVLIGKEGHLSVPSQPDGSGIDAVVVTLSAGPAIRTVVIGLLADVSLESAQKLAASSYIQVTDSIGLADRRSTEMQIDTIIRANPDLVVVAGGTEGGASRSVMKLLDVVGLACQLLPADSRPQVVYVGNQALIDKVKSKLEPITKTYTAANVRPAISLEDFGQAQQVLTEAIGQFRLRQFKGLQDFSPVAPSLTAYNFGRIIRFLSQAYDSKKGVLGIDIGASSTMIASGKGGVLSTLVLPTLGMGEGMVGVQTQGAIDEIMRWLPVSISDDIVRDYVYNKPLSPGTIPMTPEDLAIEQAVARYILKTAMEAINNRYPAIGYNPATGLTGYFEPILASGAILTQAPTAGQALLMVLDGIQPTGVTTLVLDQNNLVASLGAAGSITPVLPVQVLESGAFLNLGTVISPVSSAKAGTSILRIRLISQDGDENKYEIKQGSLTVLPVPSGRRVRVHFEPIHDTDIGLKRIGAGSSLNIVGGVLGLVIDARGRPLVLPADPSRRRDQLKKWLWTFGG